MIFIFVCLHLLYKMHGQMYVEFMRKPQKVVCMCVVLSLISFRMACMDFFVCFEKYLFICMLSKHMVIVYLWFMLWIKYVLGS